MIAGPSEILVIADGEADAAHVAADLLSQAEHDRVASAVLVTDSRDMAEQVSAEIERQLPLLERFEIARESIDRNGKIACCRVGSIPDEETFEKIVTTFMGDDYQEKQLGYYTFYAFDQKGLIPGVEFSVTSESGTETYKTEESGAVAVFTDKPGEIKVEVISVPDGYKIDDNGEVEISAVSTMIKLPVSRK